MTYFTRMGKQLPGHIMNFVNLQMKWRQLICPLFGAQRWRGFPISIEFTKNMGLSFTRPTTPRSSAADYTTQIIVTLHGKNA